MDRFKLSISQREKISYGIIISIVLILITGLVNLQIIKFDELYEQSENNRIRVIPDVPRRGLVFDRNNNIIIDNRPSYTISVVPSEIVNEVTLNNLAELINLDTLQIRKRISKNMVSPYQPSPVKRDIPFQAVAILEEQSRKFPGVIYQMEQVRQFNQELSAESFTGYVGEVSENELKQYPNMNYRLGSIIGKKGIEKQFDNKLRGSEGTEYIEITASGQIIGPYDQRENIEAVPGASLMLTIDNELQKACTQALDTFCCGAIIAVDPRNGEILALASYPGYDANIFSSVIPDTLWESIRNDSTHPLLNRPMNGLYPPGSTVKFISIGAGLEEGVITENSTFKSCLGGYQFGNRFFKCWNEAGHGRVNAAHALEVSCDTYLYQLGQKLGLEKLYEYYDRCGFGKITDIDLPSEFPGLNPNTAYYDKNIGKNKWTTGVVLNLSIGQGELLTTPLQIAQFYCGLANNGNVYQLHLKKKEIYPNGSEVVYQPRIKFKLPFSENTMRILLEGLRLVVEGEHGTAKILRNKNYSIGGKTGTAQNPHGEDHSWFAGVAPLENPEIVVVAIVENAGHGSEIAAPIVAKVIESYLTRKSEPESVAQNQKEVSDDN